MKTLETKKAPAAIGPYSQAKMTGNFLFASGQIPVDPATGFYSSPARQLYLLEHHFNYIHKGWIRQVLFTQRFKWFFMPLWIT